MFKIILPLAAAAVFAVMGCSNSPKKTGSDDSLAEATDGKAVTYAAARDAEAHNFVEIEFDPGSAALTDSAKSSLRAVLDQARQAGKIDEVIVMSWADEEYPSKNQKQLNKAQRDLAKERSEAVSRHVKSLRSVDVDAYNMTEQPNAFEKWFNTKDNRLKNSLVAAGLPTSADDPQYPSKASHSIILVKIE